MVGDLTSYLLAKTSSHSRGPIGLDEGVRTTNSASASASPQLFSTLSLYIPVSFLSPSLMVILDSLSSFSILQFVLAAVISTYWKSSLFLKNQVLVVWSPIMPIFNQEWLLPFLITALVNGSDKILGGGFFPGHWVPVGEQI